MERSPGLRDEGAHGSPGGAAARALHAQPGPPAPALPRWHQLGGGVGRFATPQAGPAALQGEPAHECSPTRPDPDRPPAPALAAFQSALAACSAAQRRPGWPGGLDEHPAPDPAGPGCGVAMGALAVQPAEPLHAAEVAPAAGRSTAAASRARPARQQAPNQAPQAHTASAAAAEYAAALRRVAPEPQARAPEPPRVLGAAAAYAAALRAAAPEQAPEPDQARRWQPREPVRPAAAATGQAAPVQAAPGAPDQAPPPLPPCPVRCRADAERMIRAFPRQADACAFADTCNRAAAAAGECKDQRPERTAAVGADPATDVSRGGEATGAVHVDEIVRVRRLRLCRLASWSSRTPAASCHAPAALYDWTPGH